MPKTLTPTKILYHFNKYEKVLKTQVQPQGKPTDPTTTRLLAYLDKKFYAMLDSKNRMSNLGKYLTALGDLYTYSFLRTLFKKMFRKISPQYESNFLRYLAADMPDLYEALARGRKLYDSEKDKSKKETEA